MAVAMSFFLFIFCPNLPHETQSWFLKPQPASGTCMALFFLSFGTYQQMPTYMAWLAINLRGNKYLAVGMAWMVAFSNGANFISANVFITNQAPEYPTAVITAITFCCLVFFLVLFGYFFIAYQNKQRDERSIGMTEAEIEADDEIHFKFTL